jgi:methyl-accepting chemotaxis protein
MFSDPLQIFAVILIFFVFLISSLGIGKKQGILAQLAAIAPNTLTSIGIFFTFLGILISLSNFDVSDINQSIPRLLDGLKLAFFSSVVGLGASVGFRFAQAFVSREGSVGEVGALEIHDQLKDLNMNTLAVRDALVGDGEASLSTQFGKLRNDFRDFADKMKEDGTEALVKALEEVIKDFNEKISEQFGENFKQLNEAVGALLKWQEEYRAQVEVLTQAFRETQTGIQNVEETTARIPTHMEAVETAFTATETRVEQLYEGVGSLNEMRESAKNAVPELQQSIDAMTTGMRESVESQMEVMRGQITEMREAQSQTGQEIRELTANLGEVIKSSLDQSEQHFVTQMHKFEGVLDSLNLGADNVLESTETVAKRVNEIIDDFSSRQEKVAREVQSRIDQSAADNVEAMNQSLQDLDKAMQQQLQRSIDKMGNNLTAITETFVNTYEENARKIVELTRSLNR